MIWHLFWWFFICFWLVRGNTWEDKMVPLDVMNLEEELTKRSESLVPILVKLLVQEKEERHKLMKDVTKIKEELVTLKREGKGPRVGFTAILHKSTGNKIISANHVIPFTHLLNSYGGGFNTTDGVFYCPADGLYIVAGSIVSDSYDLWVYVKKNGRYIGALYKAMDKTWDSASGIIVVSLVVGDQIWLSPNKAARMYRESHFSAVRISD